MSEAVSLPKILISKRAHKQLVAFACSLDRTLIGFADVEERDGGKELVVSEAYILEQKARPSHSVICADAVANALVVGQLHPGSRCFWRKSPANFAPTFSETDRKTVKDLLFNLPYLISLVVSTKGEVSVEYNTMLNGDFVACPYTFDFFGDEVSVEEAAEIEHACHEQVLAKVTLVDSESVDFAG